MTSIEARQLVHVPLASAKRFLDGFFDAHRGGADDGAHLRLHAGEFTREALVTLVADHRPGDMTPRFAVDWKDAAGGPFPTFHGMLTVAADDDYDTFSLVLDGAYTPPGGIGGQLFDAVVGKHIAQTTAGHLLDEIRRESERLFTDEEARKREIR
jgi:hypothetical protein